MLEAAKELTEQDEKENPPVEKGDSDKPTRYVDVGMARRGLFLTVPAFKQMVYQPQADDDFLFDNEDDETLGDG